MKKIIISALLTVLLTAELLAVGHIVPYVGAFGSMSNSDDIKVECRASVSALAGLKFVNDGSINVSVEARNTYGLGGHYSSFGVYVKPEYNNFYVLTGYGQTKYTRVDETFTGLRYGIGYEFDVFFIESVFKQQEKDATINIGIKYSF